MFMIIREPSAGGGAAAMSAPQERSAKQPPTPSQVQAAIKKKMEKQKKRTNEQRGSVGEVKTATPQPPRHQKFGQFPQTTAAAAEDRKSLEEELEEMMEGPQGTERQKEEDGEPVDLLPIVDSVFGQV
ncbi:hypothetical protein FQN60_010250, partial [Etheostoma spectabile]